jgi:hypothetical protein
MVLTNYFEHLNLESLDQVVFLDETWVFTKGTDSKMWSNSTSQAARKRRPTTTHKAYYCASWKIKRICF